MKGARRLWVLIVAAGVVAVVVANVALLGLASERNDPVGRLEPVATLDVPPSTGTTPGPFGVQAFSLHRTLLRVLWQRFQPERGLTGMPAGWFRDPANLGNYKADRYNL